jgi:hypothetical protein
VPALPTRSPMARERSEIDTFTIPEGRRRRVYRPGRNVGARPLDKPLEQANGEDSQEEPDQEVCENGDELVDTIQIENVLRTLDFKEEVSARDQNAKGSHRQQEQVQVKFCQEPDRIAGVGDSIRPDGHLPVHR